MAERLYGEGMHGGILLAVHAICAHEGQFGGGLRPEFEWEVGTLAIGPANLALADEHQFRVSDAVLLMDGGESTICVYDTDDAEQRIPDNDPYARGFLLAFAGYFRTHMRGEHRLCVAALRSQQEVRAAQTARSRVARLVSARTGEVLIP